MKKPWLAFVFSFLIPGAGLAYLGQWRAAIVNFGLAVVVLVGCFLLAREWAGNYIHYVYLALAAGSAGLAHAWASRLDE